jgi:SAM-dependent methyltransferase
MSYQAGAVGYAPTVKITPVAVNPEKSKYERIWSLPQYRESSPGEQLIIAFIKQAAPKWRSHVIDFGCGTGRAGKRLIEAGMRVTMLDFAKNCLDQNVRDSLSDDLRFIKHDLEKPSPVVAEYGFCADVMEHIPEGMVDVVLTNILQAAQNVFLAIHTGNDVHGDQIGEVLHVTQRPGEWWIDKLKGLGFRVGWSQSGEEQGIPYFVVYGSAWEDVADISKEGSLNTPEEKIAENIAINSAGDWMSMIPHEEQDTEVMLLGGGPTLTEHEDEIRRLRDSGVKLITLNGTYNWCLDRGIIPSATVLVDARPFNKRFVTPVVEGCKYFVSAQCDPSVFEDLPKDRTHIWYDGSDRSKEILARLGKEGYFPVAGGSTVLLRAIPLLRMLGFHKYHLFGCDSCLMAPSGNGKSSYHHHAFPQPENDNQVVIPVILTGGKVFYCNPWMALQAREYLELVKFMGEHMDMIVYGNGLLSHIIKTGAELLPEEE